MSAPSPVVELEDRIGAQLLLNQLGAGPPPYLEPRYEIVELRGRGARGVVCRARDRTLARDVGLKLYPPLPDAQLPKEVAREAQALARLDHPNVVRVHDVGAAALVTGAQQLACLYLSMEFIEGRSLRAWRSERRRPRAEVLRVLLAAGEGLAAAHDGGLIHRDFKPENVMLDARGRVRIVDFGLARGIPTEPQWSWGMSSPTIPTHELAERLTTVGSVPGTLEYMAPEARQGQTDARSDQFSFAATVWESLTGELPFDVWWVMQQSPGAPVLLRGGTTMPPRLRAVLERALSPAPDQRWPNMHALLRALRRAAGARRRIALGVLGLVATGSLGAGALSLWSQAEPVAMLAKAPSAAAQAACQSVEGKWAFHTAVAWAAEDAFELHGVNGYYELRLEPLGGCSMRLRVRKVGDSNSGEYSPSWIREAEAGVVLSPGPDGVRASTVVDLASDAKARRQRYRFELYLRGDDLRGDWRQVDRHGALEKKGGLTGGRTAPAARVLPSTEGLPCASQCRVLCSSERATQRCIESTCESREPAQPEGCAPATDFVPPAAAQANLYTFTMPPPQYGEPDPSETDRCARAERELVGSWQVWLAGDARPRSLTVSTGPLPCRLEAAITEPRGSARRLGAFVDSRGAWVLGEPSELGPPSVSWSLIGWNPAYGTTRDGIALSAHKRSPEPRALPQEP